MRTYVYFAIAAVLAAFFVAPAHAQQQTINGGDVRAGTLPVGAISATGTASGTTFLRGDGSWQVPAGGGSGTVTSVAGPSFIDWLLSGTSYTGSYATGLTSNEYDVLGVDGSGNAGLYPITASWLPASGVTAGTYMNPTLGIDATGRVIAATNGAAVTPTYSAALAATTNQANSGLTMTGTAVVSYEGTYQTSVGSSSTTLGIATAASNDLVVVTCTASTTAGATPTGVGGVTFVSGASGGSSPNLIAVYYAIVPTAGSYTLTSNGWSGTGYMQADVYQGAATSSPMTFGSVAAGSSIYNEASVTTTTATAFVCASFNQGASAISPYSGSQQTEIVDGTSYQGVGVLRSTYPDTGIGTVTMVGTTTTAGAYSGVAYAINPGSGTQSLAIDGTLVTSGATVLEADQTTSSQNGLWVASSGTWTRPSNFASGSTVAPGTVCNVTSGQLCSGSSWFIGNTTNATVGTTAETWVKSAGGASGFSPQAPVAPDSIALNIGSMTSPNTVSATPSYGIHTEPNGQIYEWQVQTAYSPVVVNGAGISACNGTYYAIGTATSLGWLYSGSYEVYENYAGTYYIAWYTSVNGYVLLPSADVPPSFSTFYYYNTSGLTTPYGGTWGTYGTAGGIAPPPTVTQASGYIGPDGTANTYWTGSTLVLGQNGSPSCVSANVPISVQCRASSASVNYTPSAWVASASINYTSHPASFGGTPTVVNGAASTAATITGNDSAGYVSVTGNTSKGTEAVVTFGTPYATTPSAVVLTPGAGTTDESVTVLPYVSALSTTGFTVSNGVAASSGDSLIWYYIVMQ